MSNNLTNKEAFIYLNKYPDLKKAFGNNIKKEQEHWINFGIKEGRTIDKVSFQDKFDKAQIIYNVQLQGGLGNQLFQLFSIHGLAHKHQVRFGIEKYIRPTHMITDKYKHIYERFIINGLNKYKFVPINEDPNRYADYINFPQFNKCTKFIGYFQSPKYFSLNREQIYDILFPNNIIHNYKLPDNISECAFIHIRLGDYLKIQIHNVDLRNYYIKCINDIKTDKFIILLMILQKAKKCILS